MESYNNISTNNQTLRERYSPNGSALRRDQNELLHMLQYIAKICEQHGITWWLSSGTLLGAARHQGFIPWDDDVDIVMLRKDYKRLKKELLNLKDERFVFHCMQSDIEYVNCFGKFRKKEGCIQVKSRRYNYYKWKGIGLDIFTIERTSFIAAKISSVVYNNLQHLTSYIRYGWIRKPLIRVVELFCLGLVNPILRLIGQINPQQEYHYSLGTGWARHTFLMKDTFPLQTASFEGIQMPVPYNMDAYLSRVYGDWREIPSEDTIKKCIHCQEYRNEIFGENQ